jgi:hypothetical protein
MEKSKLIILGGNASNNITWLKKLKKVYEKDYDVITIYYDHWNSDKKIDFDLELKKIKKIVMDLNDYYVLAKSVGSVISLIGIESQTIKPKGIIILGFPLRYLEANNLNIDSTIKAATAKTKVLLIQQKNDPVGGYNEVLKKLPNSIETVEIAGNHHVYSNFNCIKALADNFIKHLK